MTMRNRLILLASAGVGGLFGLSVSKGETTVAAGFAILFILIGLILTRFTRRLHQRFGIDSSKTSPWLLVGVVLGGVAGSYLALEWQLGEQVLEVLNPSLSRVHRGPPLSRLLGFLVGAGVGGTTSTVTQKLVRRGS
ncbi:MAG: hypothetical protein L7U72_06470 [Rubripirellula sp.]|nr:hypothetical protein [Rubripirellula sp.]